MLEAGEMEQSAPSQLDRSRAESATGTRGAAAGSSVYYRYQGADGRIVIVDSLSQVPASSREHVERVDLDATTTASTPSSDKTFVSQFDGPSFAAGFGLALLLATMVLLVRRGSLRWLGFLLVLGLLVGGFGAYLGWLRRSTGQSTAAFASPSAVINDARRAVETLQQRERERDRVIEEIQREGK
jgi:hypothetical protein